MNQKNLPRRKFIEGGPQTLKGFRDFLPADMAVRNYVKNLLISVFETYGFEPLETPALEYASVLKGKYNSETDEKLGYFFKDNGDREVGLRYDLTIPVAKVLAIYGNQILLPFKRYQIQSVWRADNTQKGRYREFIQCDIDTFGTTSPLADAEIISIIYTATQKLNFKEFTIRLNSRSVLLDTLAKNGINDNQKTVLQSLDKFQKIGQDRVKKELISKGLNITQIDSLFDYINKAKPDDQLQQVFAAVKSFGIPETFYTFDPTLVRGCDYYTGTIFETVVKQPSIGSIGGGGRYDKLIETLGGPDIPAVGYSFGFEPIIDVINELNLLPDLPKTKTKIMVANFGPETINDSLKLVSQLRQNNIASTFYPDTDKLGKQFKYADSLGIKYVAVIGPDEAKSKTVTLKNMTTGEQKTVPVSEISNNLI
ncbi:MAG: histidine--tRNA ligase [Candidatus Shapirobacteria bacterium]|nr:histidine--tRNA ligase [Candidatus Shapirobacteria bacterium]